MSGLSKGRNNGTYLSIRDGSIVKKTKDETGKWVTRPENIFKSLTGYIRDINVLDKTFKEEKYKELQVTVEANSRKSTPERFTLTSNQYRAFSDGLLLALANADLTREIEISPYIKKDNKNQKGGIKPTSFCAVRYAGEEKTIPWVSGFPDVEPIQLPDGTEYKNKKARWDFVDNIVEDLKQKLETIKETLVVADADEDEDPDETSDVTDVVDDDSDLED